MVYLVNYKSLHSVPAGTFIVCAEKRDDGKFTCISPLHFSDFVKSLIRQKRVPQALLETKRMARQKDYAVHVKYLKEAQKDNRDITIVSWELPDSSITKLREELLKAWKINYEVIR